MEHSDLADVMLAVPPALRKDKSSAPLRDPESLATGLYSLC